MPTPLLPTLTIARELPAKADVLVVGLTDAGLRDVPEPTERAFAKRYGTSVAEMAVSLGAKADGRSHPNPARGGDGPRIVVVGIGADEPSPEDLRRAAGAGVRQAAGLAETARLSVAVSLGGTEPEQAQAVAEGALLGTYRYTPISSVPETTGGIDALTVVHQARGKSTDLRPRRRRSHGPC